MRLDGAVLCGWQPAWRLLHKHPDEAQSLNVHRGSAAQERLHAELDAPLVKLLDERLAFDACLLSIVAASRRVHASPAPARAFRLTLFDRRLRRANYDLSSHIVEERCQKHDRHAAPDVRPDVEALRLVSVKQCISGEDVKHRL